MSDSTIYTIGTALRRAHDHGVPVHVLVQGYWLRGHVVAVDGHGLVLDTDHTEHSVVRMESVAAVRVLSPQQRRTAIDGTPVTVPAPRRPYD